MLNLRVRNDRTGDDLIGNYNVTAEIDGKILAAGRITGYVRESGWLTLLKWAVAVMEAVENSNLEKTGCALQQEIVPKNKSKEVK